MSDDYILVPAELVDHAASLLRKCWRYPAMRNMCATDLEWWLRHGPTEKIAKAMWGGPAGRSEPSSSSGVTGCRATQPQPSKGAE